MNRKRLLSLVVMLCIWTGMAQAQSFDFPKVWQQTPAFPTAEGFGKYASGGRGGRVVTVTTLEDDAVNPPEGSLRWALKQYPDEPLTVVFNVSGWIVLKDVLRITRSTGVTIAGQTAPGEGVTIYPRMFSINGAKNVVVRNMRFRTSSKGWDGSDLVQDVQGTLDQALCAENAENVIFDHCTFGWSAEEIVNNQTSHLQTYQYCILHEGLYDAGHHKGTPRSFGCQWGGAQSTFHHNMIINNYSRSPRLQGARKSAGDIVVYNEFLNNVIYNWGRQGAVYGGENDQDGVYSSHQINYCNNYYKPGPATKRAITNPASYRFISPSHATMVSEWHFSGNYMEGNATITEDNSKGVVNENTKLIKLLDEWLVPEVFYPGYRFDVSKYTYKDKMQTAEEAYRDVLTKAGCLTRDGIENRLVEECTTGVATYGGSLGGGGIYGIIDDPLDAEMEKNADGSYYYPREKRDARPDAWDTDGDGMPDAWEDANGFDKSNPADGNYVNGDGYTALDKYLASLMGEEITGTFTAPDAYMKIVAADGTGDFTTVQAAVDACSQDGTRNFIFIKNGTYNEQVTIPGTSVITMLGESRDGVVITRAKSHQEVDDEKVTTTMYIDGTDFYGENFTVVNSAGPAAGQAEALTNHGDRMTLKNVAIKGNQDGLRFDDSSRSYLYKCYVEGTVDYIFDSGIAFLDSCEIKQVNQAGYIVAPGNHFASVGREVTNEATGYSNVWGLGLFLRNCILTADNTIGAKTSHLGRNWGKQSSAAYFINCRMGNHISDVGFVEMSAGATRYLGEYGSMDLDGNKLDLSKRVSWSITQDENHNPQIMTSALINNLLNTEYVYAQGAEQSTHCSGTFAPKPMVSSPLRPAKFTNNAGVLAWTKIDAAKGYLIYKNGRFLALATTNSYTDDTYSNGDVYALRSMSVNGSLSLVAEAGKTYSDMDDTPQEGVEDDGIFPGNRPIEEESTANTDAAATNYTATQWEHYAATDYAGGSGTADDPYLIETAEQLMKLAVNVENKEHVEAYFGDNYSKGKYFKQTKDIILSEDALAGINWVSHTFDESPSYKYVFKELSTDPETYTRKSSNRTFSGIGKKNNDDDYQRFAGVYDGDGHAIIGMINQAAGISAVFNETNGAIVRNLIVKDSYVAGNSNASLLVARAVGTTVINCYTSGVLFNSGSYGAGLIGNADNCRILNSASDAWTWGKNNMGGLAGKVLNGSLINNCYFGGWAGARFWAGSSFKYCGAVSPELGYNTPNEARNCYWADTCTVRYFATPLEAVNAGNSTGGTLTNCKAVSTSEAEATVAALNAEVPNIPGAYMWKVENGVPMLDFTSVATGISEVPDNSYGNSTGNHAVYTLQGIRVTKPGKGLYVINGKKVVIK
ncbi:MAG: pectinesterase family protein [Bacteroidales bacterium]|nr:pectinesterase family protein [Bacteroidales bacterium]MCM1146271.1 pectinesterase family protein [Bacteroidales bacterium]MCM1205291.1 pectinesterase family protein [Bacillota bacterium]MCM1509622.1 pectinesterase family protein [Clostridium sp.]